MMFFRLKNEQSGKEHGSILKVRNWTIDTNKVKKIDLTISIFKNLRRGLYYEMCCLLSNCK